MILVSAIIVADSQTFAYIGDESFHLLAAKLVSAGRVPYRDFFYQHPPLFIYIIGGLFRLVGVSWRAAHGLSALALIGGIFVAAIYARDLFAEENLRWRNAALVVILLGLNAYALVFGPTGFPQGFCILCLMGALYQLRSPTQLGSFCAGVLAACAVESIFLAVPAFVVFVLWLALKDRKRALWFIAGAFVAFIPLIIMLVAVPSETFADVFRYHLLDRPRMGWRYNSREVLRWFSSLQGVILSAFAIAAVSLRKDDDVRLCGWTALALVVTISLAKTTSSSYFLVATPFLAILAATGLIELTQQKNRFARRMVLPVVGIYLVGLVALRNVTRTMTFYFDHHLVENVVQRLDACASRGEVYAPEAVYFARHALPPRGFENRFDPSSRATHALDDRRVDAIVVDSRDPRITQFDLRKKFARIDEVPPGLGYVLVFCNRI